MTASESAQHPLALALGGLSIVAAVGALGSILLLASNWAGVTAVDVPGGVIAPVALLVCWLSAGAAASYVTAVSDTG